MPKKSSKAARRKPFPRKDAIDRLIWCNRHCCLCDKPCGVHIELAHIDNDRTKNDIDNAIPVCYECHAMIGSYNDLHPRGQKFKVDEIKGRREFIYDKYTREYLAPIEYKISNQKDPWNDRKSGTLVFPEVGFSIRNLSDFLPTKLKVLLVGRLNGRPFSLNLIDPLYRGQKKWNLNPRRQVNGWFAIRNRRAENPRPNDRFEIRVHITQWDTVGREHILLEDGYASRPREEGSVSEWAFEPASLERPQISFNTLEG